MSNNSDYTLPRTKMHDLLPEPYGSDVNRVVFENLFNRFLTKTETKKVAGYIGTGNPNALISRRIKEPTIERQANQLQPMLYAKIGSVEHISSWKDILNELERLGVDIERLPIWGSSQEFNWVPPIDIDKVIHFRDYFWVDDENPSSQPQYITIRSRCATATAQAAFHQRLVDQFGATIAVTNIGESSTPGVYDKLIVTGDQTRLFETGFVFFFKNTLNVDLADTFLTVASSSYTSGTTDSTAITLTTTFTSTVSTGDISLQEQLDIFTAERDCQCTGSVGWDLFGWDDNPEVPVWNGDLASLITSISNTTNPNNAPNFGAGVQNQLWFDTTADILYQYDSVLLWKVIFNNFQTVVDSTQGLGLWDFTPSCGVQSIVPAADQWINQNKWVHKTSVTNFSVAKQAAAPIIEFDWDLELNEWTATDYTWKYRAEKFVPFAATTATPSLFELIPLPLWNIGVAPEDIILDERYGDLTTTFTTGTLFQSLDTSDILEVVSSTYQRATPTSPFTTVVKITVPVVSTSLTPAVSPLRPVKTSQGDAWKNYHDHWLFVEATATTATVHQPANELIPVAATAIEVVDVNYTYTTSAYAQVYTVTTAGTTTFTLVNTPPLGSSRSLRRRALAGYDDIRVYVNDIRVFGTYEELTETDLVTDVVTGITESVVYVSGIEFITGFEPTQSDTIRIEVGEASYIDFGLAAVPVRTIEDNTAFDNITTGGTRTQSLIRVRKAEQVKTTTNQYPLFDLYDVEGNAVAIASPIFTFLTSPSAPISIPVGQRIVVDATGTNFSFEQHLCAATGALYAYRDYSNMPSSYWINPTNNTVRFWTGLAWSEKGIQGNQYTEATISATTPTSPFTGQIWLNSVTKELKAYSGVAFVAINPTFIVTSTFDVTLQTVWKKGVNNEAYVPVKRDANNRTEQEYNTERDAYFVETGLTLTDWLNTQKTELTPTGEWIGDWEIPNQLYHNNQHENRKVLQSSELLSHFDSIIQAQPALPGFNGSANARFHLIQTANVNYGLGGLIKEYNGGFDTFLSSVFNNNVTPPTLFEFAHDQYEALINTITEAYRKNIPDFLTNTEATAVTSLDAFISTQLISAFEQNDNAAKLYGDSTSGFSNWIATLPYLNLSASCRPEILIDVARDVSQLVHHDGHRECYELADTTVANIISRVVNTVDPRSTLAAPNNKFGKISPTSPPNNLAEFSTAFGETAVNRHGVFWYTVVGTQHKFYRLVVAAVGPTAPTSSLEDGTLWMDTTAGNQVLRIKNGLLWDVVSGLSIGDGRFHNGTTVTDLTTATVSAWQEIKINEIMLTTLLDIETQLYTNAPTTPLVFDFADLQATPADRALYAELQRVQFLDFVRQSEISAPFINDRYDPTLPFTWNYTRSVPGIAYEIIATDTGTNKFIIDGNHATSFPAASTFFIKNGGPNDGQWTVTIAVDVGTTTEIVVTSTVASSAVGVIYKGQLPSSANTGGESGGDWRDLYQKFYNTPYPNLEPWKLQGFKDKPTWWDSQYANDDVGTYGTRRWKYIHSTTTGMWEEIRVGRVPAGELLPSGITLSTGAPGQTTTYNYFSVNIDDVVITPDGGTTNYAPDDVLPPFFDHVAAGEPAISSNRSVFKTFTEIVSPGADYMFGDAGPTEYEWRASSQFLYDMITVAYKMQPVKLFNSAFGFDTVTINDLQIDTRTQQTPSHTRTEFHGEVVDNELFQVTGFNQWYVNFNRFMGFDTSLSDFRSLWTQWTAPMMYQFATFVDTSSLQVAHRIVTLSEFDYTVSLKRSPGAEDFWMDAFNVRVLFVPIKSPYKDNHSTWLLELDTHSPLNRTISYYDVRNYQFSVDPVSDVCTLFSYEVQDTNIITDTFAVSGNQTAVFGFGREFSVINSIGNNGTYTSTGGVFDSTTNTTLVAVTTSIPSPISDGTIIADYRTLPWETGDSIWFDSEHSMPAPLQADQRVVGPTRYFIIKINSTQFKVANTQQNAFDGLPIDITSTGIGSLSVGEISTTFQAAGGRTDTYWRHYVIDKSNVLTFTPPTDVRGMQRLVDIVDGYASYTKDLGFDINERRTQTDPTTGRFVDWQVETERFINFAYGLKLRVNKRIENRYAAVANAATDTFTWTSTIPQFVTGSAINIISLSGVLPTPLLAGLKYYVIRDSQTEFRLAATRIAANQGISIDISNVTTTSQLEFVDAQEFRTTLPSQEINPFRNELFFRQPRGIVSNLLTGPTEDIRNTQLLFDQYGRPLNRKQLRILREDKITQITVPDNIANDVELTSVLDNPYNYIHLGGAHVFIDAFEHVLIFNNETTEGALLYDPFLGLNVTKFELLFHRQLEFTNRPNVGGSYFKTFFNQGAELVDNFESAVHNIRTLYDSHRAIEAKPLVREARKSLGYEGTRDYLDNMNLNEKSQFLFWRGLIQNKGSLQSINAFINSRRFIDAKVDEFWAYKIAEFGSARDQEYPEMYLTTKDARSNDLRLQFIESGDFCESGFGEDGFDDCGFDILPEDAVTIDSGFTPILLTNESRWFNQPDQLEVLRNNGLAMYFELKTNHRLNVVIQPTAPLAPLDNQGWIDTSASPVLTFNRYVASTSTFEQHGTWNILTDLPILRHNHRSDSDVVMVRTQPEGTRSVHVSTARTAPAIPGQIAGSFVPGTKAVTLLTNYIPFTSSIKVFKNGIQLDQLIDYVETITGIANLFSTEIVVVDPLTANDVIEVAYGPSTLLEGTHFERINSKTVRLLTNDLIAPTHELILWGQVVNEETQTPAKIIDRKSNVVVSQVQIWDPARGLHYQTALPIVQIQRDTDPAVYTNSIETNQTPPGSQVAPYILYNDPWNFAEVGTTWMDTSNLDYKPYYDKSVITDIDDRLRAWGQLSEWASLNIYEWVESDVPPEDYDAAAIAEEGNRDIPEHLRKAGRVRQTTFELIGLTDFIPLVVKYQEFDVAIEGVETAPGTYDFTLAALPNNINVGDEIDVYINGRLKETSVVATAVMTVTDLTEADSVRFVKPIPEEALILQGIEDGVYFREIEHTQVSDFDEFGLPRIKYYFWVAAKGTRNQTQKISPRDAQLQLITIPSPYMVSVNSLPATRRNNGVVVDFDRSWNLVITSADTDRFTIYGKQAIGLGVAVKGSDIANVSISLNGTALVATTDFTITASGREIEILTPLVIDDVLAVDYVTEIATELFELPPRSTQIVVRGLRGIITDDQRFTLRFTRDFTLRDRLISSSGQILKQHHEEWQLFREQQPTLIPRVLWNKITESIVGYLLADNSIRVPSLTRELYDVSTLSSTRFGLGSGQTFTDGPAALATILADLQNPDNEFAAVNINSFFSLNSFDTPTNIITAMNTIYNTFAFVDVNRMFFAVLHDAMSFRTDYADIMKTSMVAIHGIRPFQASGIFDD